MQNYSQVFQKDLTVHGFLVTTLLPKYLDGFYKEMVPLVREGKISHKEDLVSRLEKHGEALLDIFRGKNRGKKIVAVAEE